MWNMPCGAMSGFRHERSRGASSPRRMGIKRAVDASGNNAAMKKVGAKPALWTAKPVAANPTTPPSQAVAVKTAMPVPLAAFGTRSATSADPTARLTEFCTYVKETAIQKCHREADIPSNPNPTAPAK